MKAWLIFLLLSFSGNVLGHGGGEAAIEIGPTKGVTEVTKDKSFKLSPEAIKRLEITWAPINEGMIRIPKTAIANALSESNVFRFRDGWIKSVRFKVLNKGDQITVQSPEIQKGDQIVRTGVGYLRIIASQLGEIEEEEGETSDEVDEHGHAKKPEEDEHGHGKKTDEDKHDHGKKAGEDKHGHDEEGGEHRD